MCVGVELGSGVDLSRDVRLCVGVELGSSVRFKVASAAEEACMVAGGVGVWTWMGGEERGELLPGPAGTTRRAGLGAAACGTGGGVVREAAAGGRGGLRGRP